MIVWGGFNETLLLNTGGRFTPASNSWRAISSTDAPSARFGHTAVWTGTEMIVWGGTDAAGARLNTGGRYTPATDTWTPVTTTGAPDGASSHTAVWTGTEMIVWGGFDTGDTFLNTGARYNPALDTWTPLSPIGAPDARFGHTAVWTGTEMVVWGGGSGGSPDCGFYCALNDGGRYIPATDTWTAVTTVGAPDARFDHTAVWTGSEMIVWGGRTSVTFTTNTGGRYNPTTGTWTAMTGAGAPSERMEHSAVWTGTEMIVWGGGDAILFSGADDRPNGVATGGRYFPASDTWAGVTAIDAPGARRAHTAVWTGSVMIVCGGWNTDRFGRPPVGDIGNYLPTTNSWGGVPVTAHGVPPGNTAVWTGSELMVFGGGFDYSILSSNPWRYSPVTHSWTASATVDAPSGRKSHTAVWTGSEMIIWGGYNFDFYRGYWAWQVLADGGRYAPANDSWSPVTTTGAPSARQNHSAVWTGTEMIIWGGQVPSIAAHPGVFNDGARYSPATNSWAAVTATGAPSQRYGHTAVWTGTEMIVWGAGNGGGRYNPAADTWTATSATGAPGLRYAHTAVWTGTEMIVWGGSDADGASLNTGGRYHPATDTWTAMTSVGAPPPRSGHTAVWTGREMIVWGGENSLKTGARYTPATDSWTAMTTVGAGPASGTTAVWTGSEMIVPGLSGAYSYILDDGSFNIGTVVRSGTDLIISFPSVTNCTYTLWRSDSLADGTWIDAGVPALVGTGATLTFTAAASTPASGFFRIQAGP